MSANNRVIAIAELQQQLKPHIPEAATPYVATIIDQCHPVMIKLTRGRLTKLGDYRSPLPDEEHVITINGDLNQYSFLITLLHELAHLTCFLKYRNKVAPHGPQWKLDFKTLLEPILLPSVLPPDVLAALAKYLQNPAASSCTDSHLHKTLKRYDPVSLHPVYFVEELPNGSLFQLKNGLTLTKGKRLRKRYECKEIKTGKMYLVSPIAEAHVIE